MKMLIFVLLFSFFAISCTGYNPIEPVVPIEADTVSPTVGNFSLTIAQVTSVQVAWTHAMDNVTQKDNLKYKLVYSTNQSSINTVDHANLCDKVVFNWANNIYTKKIENLELSTKYYLALLVKDEAGNMSLYNIISATTKNWETKIYFENGSGSYYITDIEGRYSPSDNWISLRSGYPYINTAQDKTYPNISPQYSITKSTYWIRFKVTRQDSSTGNTTLDLQEMLANVMIECINANWAMKELKDLQPGKIYRVVLYEPIIYLYGLSVVGNY